MLIVLLISLLAASHECHAQLTFQRLSAGGGVGQPSARYDAATAISAGTMYLFGGRGSSGSLSDTWSFNLNTATWQQLAPVGGVHPAARFSMVSGFHANGFVIATGEGDGGAFFNDVWIFNPNTVTWTELTPLSGSAPQTRYGTAGGVFPGSPYLFVSHGFASQRYSNTFRFHLVNRSWETVFGGTHPYSPAYPHARCLMGSAMVAAEDFVFFGGCLSGGKSGGPCPSFDSWHFSSGDWRQMENGPAPNIHSQLVYVGGNNVIMYGGQQKTKQILSIEKSPSDEVDVLDLDSREWTRRRASGAPTSLRYSHSMAMFPNGSSNFAAVMFGGLDVASGAALGDVWVLLGTSEASVAASPKISGRQTWVSTTVLHAIFMAVGWGILLQAGAFIARYFRHKDPLWFKAHRALQMSGLLLSIIGLIFGFMSVQSKHLSFAHGAIGIIIMIIGIAQPINAVFRPHKVAGQPLSVNRKRWEFLHINAGRLALILAVINIPLGLFMIVAPKGAWVTWFVLFSLLVVAYVVMEYRKRKENVTETKL